MNAAINYFLDQIPGIANDNCKLYFDFIKSGSNVSRIYNKSGDSNITGILDTSIYYYGWQDAFWNNPNPPYNLTESGYFSVGRSAIIVNTTGIDIQDFTLCLVYENLKRGGSTLISTIKTGNIQTYTELGAIKNNFVYKGFDFGITSNNRLYFEYFSENGPEIFVGDDALANKNSIFLSITQNSLSFGYYDFFKNNLISYDHNISTKYLYDSNSLYLGYNPSATGTYAFNSKFTGFMDELLIFSPSIYNYEIVNINSGFVNQYLTGSLSVSIENLVTGITGYQSGIIGYTVELTGVELTATGEITGDFGEIYSGYVETLLTGSVPASGLIDLTGVISFDTVTGYSGDSIIKNSGYLNSFGKNYINFLSKNTEDDFIELNLLDSYDNTLLKNSKLSYQIFSERFTLDENINLYPNSIIYANGQLQHTGGFYVTGTNYNSGKYLINDYITDGNSIYFYNKYNQNDNLMTDFVLSYNTGLFIDDFSVTGGVGYHVLTGWSGNLYNIYFNGLKLISGLDYNLDGNNNIQFNKNSYYYTGITGNLVGIIKSTNFTITGSGNNFKISKPYLYNFSEIYKNGVRQLLDTDYLELAGIDSNTGKGFFDVKANIIYNNGGFFNL